MEALTIAQALGSDVNTIYSDLQAFECYGIECIRQRLCAGAHYWATTGRHPQSRRIITNKSTCSTWMFNSNTSHCNCSENARMHLPIFTATGPLRTRKRYIGVHTIWYRQYLIVRDSLRKRLIDLPPLRNCGDSSNAGVPLRSYFKIIQVSAEQGKNRWKSVVYKGVNKHFEPIFDAGMCQLKCFKTASESCLLQRLSTLTTPPGCGSLHGTKRLCEQLPDFVENRLKLPSLTITAPTY